MKEEVFEVINKYRDYTLMSCIRSESGLTSLHLLLRLLSIVCILVSACGLFCFVIKYPYIGIVISLIGAILFFVLAFRSKPTKESSTDTTKYYNHPNTRLAAFQRFEQFIRKCTIPKRCRKSTQESKKHSQYKDNRNSNKDSSHSSHQGGNINA